MIKYNDTYIVGIDHGYGNIKTANFSERSGVSISDDEPLVSRDVLEYNGKYIKVGDHSQTFTADKTTTDDSYYLTLWAIAKEFNHAGITEGDVHLAVGLPLTWVTRQREEFSNYLLRNENVEFRFKGKDFKVHFTGIHVFPQGYCAVYDRFNEMDGICVIADIGNGTMNLMRVEDHKGINDSCRTEMLGVGKCIEDINAAFSSKYQETIVPSAIINQLIGKDKNLPEAYKKLIDKCAENYANTIMSAICNYGYNENYMKLYVVGGGATVMQRYGYNPKTATYITDICANAKGYEHNCRNKMRKNR